MTHSFVMLLYRQPHLTPQEFRKHIQHDWHPIHMRVIAPSRPLSIVLHYPERVVNGAGTRFALSSMLKGKGPDDAPVVAIGDPKDADTQWDALFVLRMADELSLLELQSLLYHGPESAALVAEEEKWCLPEKTKVIFLGESVELCPDTCDEAPRPSTW
ncbi:hypothetical protein ACN47E_004336 [Coniothyrium glycines]